VTAIGRRNRTSNSARRIWHSSRANSIKGSSIELSGTSTRNGTASGSGALTVSFRESGRRRFGRPRRWPKPRAWPMLAQPVVEPVRCLVGSGFSLRFGRAKMFRSVSPRNSIKRNKTPTIQSSRPANMSARTPIAANMTTAESRAETRIRDDPPRPTSVCNGWPGAVVRTAKSPSSRGFRERGVPTRPDRRADAVGTTATLSKDPSDAYEVS
jgi:hypothetical protein